MPLNIICTPTLDFCHNVKIYRPKYNMHPHISTQEVSIYAKNGDEHT